MIRTLLAAALLASAVPAAASGDLVYTYRASSELAPLKGYHGRPYWQILAECAGANGALVNLYQATGKPKAVEITKTKGVEFLRAANNRLKVDRGLTSDAALALTTPFVDEGRASGVALLERSTASGFSHEQLIDAMCSQVGERHARAARNR